MIPVLASSITLILGVILSIPVLLCLSWLMSYYYVVLRKNKANRAFSLIDIQLKRRWDIIPQLVTTAKAYSIHEKTLLEQVTQARDTALASTNLIKRFNHEDTLSIAAPSILALSETYPELKADKQFELLQRNLTEIESLIAAARHSYNTAATRYNTSLKTPLTHIFPQFYKFRTMSLFETCVSERQHKTPATS